MPQHKRTQSFAQQPSFLVLQLLLLVLAYSLAFAPTRTTVKVSIFKQRTFVNLAAAAVPSLSSSPCRVAIIGGGPSGLLLAYFLGKSPSNVQVTVWERRPKQVDKEQRTYTFGIGRRGRTAIQKADSALWEAVKKEGFSTDRSDLHLVNLPFSPVLRLRDEKDSLALGVEPSLLLFQSDLCLILAQEIKKYNNVQINFDSKVTSSSIDLDKMTINANDGRTSYGPYDLIVGYDGVNSSVRQAMADRFGKLFQCRQERLPELYKVARGPMPSELDESAVALMFPKKGSMSTVVGVIPTGDDTACILFVGSNASDPLLSFTDTQLLEQEIMDRFPKLFGLEKAAAQQLAQQAKAAQASNVVCNTYHVPNRNVALIGDAAHATGGGSGQGVNSALVDAQVLADCLLQSIGSTIADSAMTATKQEAIQAALLEYSIRQVPEGAALCDLSSGPKLESQFKRLRWGLKNLVDSVFKGRLLGIGESPLHTRLTTSLQPFAEIRRERQVWYDPEEFPSPQEWKDKLTKLHEQMIMVGQETKKKQAQL